VGVANSKKIAWSGELAEICKPHGPPAFLISPDFDGRHFSLRCIQAASKQVRLSARIGGDPGQNQLSKLTASGYLI
jgi:hypothetical protein